MARIREAAEHQLAGLGRAALRQLHADDAAIVPGNRTAADRGVEE